MSENTQLATHSSQETGLVPTNIQNVSEFAHIMAQANVLPDHLRGKEGDCFRVCYQAAKWEMDPFGVADSTSLIHGKLMYEGKLVAAVINARGGLKSRLNYKFTGEGTNRKLTVIGTLKGEDEAREIDLTFNEAQRINKNGQIRNQPDQQMCYIGARIWARRHVPELMLGVYTDDERFGDVEEEPEAKAEGEGEPEAKKSRPTPPKKKGAAGAKAAAKAPEKKDADVSEMKAAEKVEEPEEESKKKEEPKAKEKPKEEPKEEEKPKEEPKAKEKPKEEPKAKEKPKEEPKEESKATRTELNNGEVVTGNFSINSVKKAKDAEKNPILVLEVKGDLYEGVCYCRDVDNKYAAEEGMSYLEIKGQQGARAIVAIVTKASDVEDENVVHF